jgi:hypothetical protein
MGVTGLMNIPSADMQADGIFMAGANYLPYSMLPLDGAWSSNGTANYFLNVTFLPFLEVAYRCTLLYSERDDTDNRWQQDRSVSVRLRLLKERNWLPSVLVGSNDAFTTNQLNPLHEVGGNRFFSSVYAVATKHFRPYGHDVSLTFGGMIPVRKQAAQDGFFAGIGFSPAQLKQLTVIAEYDTNKINVGISARLFGHISAHVFTYGFNSLSFGLRYELALFGKA